MSIIKNINALPNVIANQKLADHLIISSPVADATVDWWRRISCAVIAVYLGVFLTNIASNYIL